MKKKAQRWRRGLWGDLETIGPDGLRWQVQDRAQPHHAEVGVVLPLPSTIGDVHPLDDHAIVSWWAESTREAKAQAMAFAARADWKRLVLAIRRERAEVFKKTKKKRARVRVRKGTAKR